VCLDALSVHCVPKAAVVGKGTPHHALSTHLPQASTDTAPTSSTTPSTLSQSFLRHNHGLRSVRKRWLLNWSANWSPGPSPHPRVYHQRLLTDQAQTQTLSASARRATNPLTHFLHQRTHTRASIHGVEENEWLGSLHGSPSRNRRSSPPPKQTNDEARDLFLGPRPAAPRNYIDDLQ
jgi:hypothetical protein